jgi:hypothetical protein
VPVRVRPGPPILGGCVFSHGIKASELIIRLQNQIQLHGDCEVFSGGQDYPEGVKEVVHDPKGDAYHPKNCFRIY